MPKVTNSDPQSRTRFATTGRTAISDLRSVRIARKAVPTMRACETRPRYHTTTNGSRLKATGSSKRTGFHPVRGRDSIVQAADSLLAEIARPRVPT